MKTKFYTFWQNNSGGFFNNDYESGVSEVVIIEAASAEKANDKALELGIYFNGCETGLDCDCCGDRWYEASETEGDDVPTFYNKEVKDWIEDEKASGYVHYLDGTVRKFNRRYDMPF
jgi:hypothetical protein